MHSEVKSTFQFGRSQLPRRLLLAFVAVCFLCTITGAISLLHHHDAHNGPADSQCQICYLLTVAATGQVVALIALFVLAAAPRRFQLPVAAVVYVAGRLDSSAPRAPPLF